MRRWLPNLLLAGPTALALTAVALWVAAQWRCDVIAWHRIKDRKSQSFFLSPYRDRLALHQKDDGLVFRLQWLKRKPASFRGANSGIVLSPAAQWLDVAGFNFLGGDTLGGGSWLIAMPYWALALGFAAPPAWRLHVWRRRRRRKRKGQCPRCGYDLRQSGGDCPECGARSTSAPPSSQSDH